MTREELRAAEVRIVRELFSIPEGPWAGTYEVPAYSAGMLLAEPLAAKLRDLGWLVILKWIPEDYLYGIHCPGDKDNQALCELFNRNTQRFAWGDTMPEALVKAAVLAIDAMKKVKVPPFEETDDVPE